MTHDTRVVDWLGHSGASLKMGRSGGEIHSLSQQRPWFIDKKLYCVPECLRPWFQQHMTGFSYIPRKPIGLMI